MKKANLNKKQKQKMLYYREKSEDTRISQSKGRVLLKILIVEASGSKLIKFDRTSTIAEAISRILLSYKVEAHHIPLYRLFIPLGAPLELSDTLEQLQLQDYDPLEFKKLPPHLLQLIDLKPSPPPVPSRNSVHSHYPVSASPPSDRSSQRENAHTVNSHIPVTEWTVNEVAKWLEEIGYGELAPDFIQRSITGESLFSLNKDNLRDRLFFSFLLSFLLPSFPFRLPPSPFPSLPPSFFPSLFPSSLPLLSFSICEFPLSVPVCYI